MNFRPISAMPGCASDGANGVLGELVLKQHTTTGSQYECPTQCIVIGINHPSIWYLWIRVADHRVEPLSAGSRMGPQCRQGVIRLANLSMPCHTTCVKGKSDIGVHICTRRSRRQSLQSPLIGAFMPLGVKVFATWNVRETIYTSACSYGGEFNATSSKYCAHALR